SCFTRISGRFPSVLRFRLYQILAGPIFAGAFPPFGFFAFPTLPDPISFRFRSEFVSDSLSEGGAFRLIRLYQIALGRNSA
ncbi:hypothetical protein AB0K49_31890, partial [Streptomyces decoyicus]|uniref:hypothetical protein n=1 Tax=Streptomyces decoyicus TaxID=249567 RepID=UPI00345DDA53